MFKDITLAHYVPGTSIAYRLDPRSKVVSTVFFVVALLSTSGIVSYGIVVAWSAAAVIASHIGGRLIWRSLKGFMSIIIVMALFHVFLTPGTIWVSWGAIAITREGVSMGLEVVLRFILLVAGTSLLTYTTSPLCLLAGLERLLRPLRIFGVQVHELSMTMIIALRFIPIMIVEVQRIKQAQWARGADFTSGNPLRRMRSMVPLIVPLFVSAWQRTDELSTAMECRCYRGGENRTELYVPMMTGLDYAVLTLAGLMMLAVIFLRWSGRIVI